MEYVKGRQGVGQQWNAKRSGIKDFRKRRIEIRRLSSSKIN